jgi:hypothetical protein
MDHHASLTHPHLQEVTIRWRGSFGYLIGWAGEGDQDDEQIPLCRIEYLGHDEDWGFALYDPATETYAPAMLPTGHPNDAFDTAAIIHLADYQQEAVRPTVEIDGGVTQPGVRSEAGTAAARTKLRADAGDRRRWPDARLPDARLSAVQRSCRCA